MSPTCSSCSVSTLARPTALPLRLRGGATDNGDGDDCPTEIGGVRPEDGADVDPEGVRMEFHSIKEGQLEALRSGDLQVSEELKARKKDKDSFAKVPYDHSADPSTRALLATYHAWILPVGHQQLEPGGG